MDNVLRDLPESLQYLHLLQVLVAQHLPRGTPHARPIHTGTYFYIFVILFSLLSLKCNLSSDCYKIDIRGLCNLSTICNCLLILYTRFLVKIKKKCILITSNRKVHKYYLMLIPGSVIQNSPPKTMNKAGQGRDLLQYKISKRW